MLTGIVAHRDAGPAVILSYLVAAMAALASAICYTEFAVDMPTTGGAYNYVVHTFGEVMAWFVAWNLLLEYTLSVAAVARGFTAYFSSPIGHSPSELRVDLGALGVHLDLPALGVVLLIGGLLCYGTKESARFNSGVTGLNVVTIPFIMGVGYPLGFKASNFRPFAPYGAKGVFRGASKPRKGVFFSFVGFDSIATTAEECKNPKVDLPMGILGAICISAVLYAGMSGAICGMVNYADMDVDDPFAQAFHLLGMGWAAELVAVGAVTGILTSMLVSLMGATRIYVVLGRERLLPAKLCNLSEARGTPVAATVITAASAGFLAFVMDIEALADLGTLLRLRRGHGGPPPAVHNARDDLQPGAHLRPAARPDRVLHRLQHHGAGPGPLRGPDHLCRADCGMRRVLREAAQGRAGAQVPRPLHTRPAVPRHFRVLAPRLQPRVEGLCSFRGVGGGGPRHLPQLWGRGGA